MSLSWTLTQECLSVLSIAIISENAIEGRGKTWRYCFNVFYKMYLFFIYLDTHVAVLTLT